MNNNPTPQSNAIPRRNFLGVLAAAGSAFAIPASKFTVDLLTKARTTLPVADKLGTRASNPIAETDVKSSYRAK